MKYATPELVVIGAASALVQGGGLGRHDNGGSWASQADAGMLLGLDE